MLAEPGYHTRAFVEWEDWPRAVLIAAQAAGFFAPAPIWTDLRSFDARPFRGAFDIVLAGYPCQPFSAAGKRGGADDPRHLWPDVSRVIGECRPEWVFLENVAGHVTLGETDGQRVHRSVQRPVPCRVPERALVPDACGCGRKVGDLA
jgi:site-specific DNA-cytosine methylase